jgi:hydroxymethylglutaryl-CoA synthase
VAGLDEDVITMSIEAARNALARAGIEALAQLRAVWVGSESHPYAVKPSSTVVAEAIGATCPISHGPIGNLPAKPAPRRWWRRWLGRFGHGALCAGHRHGYGAGAPRAMQLEYTAGCGGAAFLLGPAEEALAVIEAAYSYVTDTPDFWRRPMQNTPNMGSAFTGEPAYFHTSPNLPAKQLMKDAGRQRSGLSIRGLSPAQTKVPAKGGWPNLGFTPSRLTPGLLSPLIGNTYAGAALIGLSAVLDVAKPGERILVVSFGSGAGSDAFDDPRHRSHRSAARAPRTAGLHRPPHRD